MPETSKIGVVTVTYNSSQVIDGFMKSVLQQTHENFILYIVDNASSDQTLEQVRQYGDPRLCLIANPNNVGIAEANNQGILAGLAAGCKSILFINNDTEFEPSLLDKMATGLQRCACEMLAPKIVFHNNQHIIWSAGGGFDRLKGYAGFHYGFGETDHGQFDNGRLVEHAPACCLLVRKEVFERIGLMDSRYFVYLDDTDFCYRARQAGIRLCYFPSAILLHKASSLTGGADSDFSVRYRTRNQVYFMLKHLGPWRGLYYLPAFQIHQLIKLVSRRIDLAGFFLRESAFIEGLKVWRHSVANEGQRS